MRRGLPSRRLTSPILKIRSRMRLMEPPRLVRRACSDGMSDRPYGLVALAWDRGDRLYEGCCTLQP